jgi:hypothetical protein
MDTIRTARASAFREWQLWPLYWSSEPGLRVPAIGVPAPGGFQDAAEHWRAFFRVYAALRAAGLDPGDFFVCTGAKNAFGFEHAERMLGN